MLQYRCFEKKDTTWTISTPDVIDHLIQTEKRGKHSESLHNFWSNFRFDFHFKFGCHGDIEDALSSRTKCACFWSMSHQQCIDSNIHWTFPVTFSQLELANRELCSVSCYCWPFWHLRHRFGMRIISMIQLPSKM